MSVDSGKVLSTQEPLGFVDTETYKLTEEHADVICQRISEGKTTKDACAEINIPYSVYLRWKTMFPWFGVLIKEAMKERAHFYYERVVEEAESISSKEDAIVKRAKMDAFKWAAEKGNPDEYGNKTKISGDEKAPLQLIIETGVPQKEERDAGPVQIEGENNVG